MPQKNREGCAMEQLINKIGRVVEPGKVDFITRSIKEPEGDKVLIKIVSSAICGSDSHIFKGKHPTVPLPVTIGHEFSGDVIDVGEDMECIRHCRGLYHKIITAGFLLTIGGRRISKGFLQWGKLVKSMEDYIKYGGKSRGSALYTDKDGTKPYESLPNIFRFTLDDGTIGDMVQEVIYKNGECEFNWRKVRPLPKDEDFFENVWKSYRENGNIY